MTGKWFAVFVALLSLSTILIAAAGAGSAAAAADTDAPAGAAAESCRLYIGTYTGRGSEGIYQARLNMATGKLDGLSTAAETENPSRQCDPTKPYVPVTASTPSLDLRPACHDAAVCRAAAAAPSPRSAGFRSMTLDGPAF